MIIKKEYKSNNVILSTVIDGVDRYDEGKLDNGVRIINIYKKGRQKEDDFETIEVVNMNIYIMNDNGQTLEIIRSH